jgi:dTDP-glucose 4,6-dehydratase
MRVLVTGSLGFVGQHLTARLRAMGHDVYGCDLTHAADEVPWSLRGDHPEAEQRSIRADIGDRWQLERALAVSRPEVIYNTAGEFGRYNGADWPRELWQTNVVGLRYLLDLQRRDGFRLIHFSSSEVYGDEAGWMAEDLLESRVVWPLTDYALSKFVNERQIRNARQQYRTNTVIIRLFNLYGPGERYSPYRSVVCRFLYAALRGLPLRVHVGHYRSNLYIDDAMQALTQLTQDVPWKPVYNLASETLYSIEELAEMAIKVTGADPALMQTQASEAMTTRSKRADVNRAQADLGLRATVGLEEGMQRTAAWMRATYGL